MKKILALAVLVALSSIVFVGCKKGPEDPFLSFKSRKKRMQGDWHCTEYKIDGVDSITRADVVTSTGSAPCGTKTITITRGLGINLHLGSDGNYSMIFTTDSSYTLAFQNPTASASCQTISAAVAGRVDRVEKGEWQFAGGIGQYKNKQLLELIESTDDVIGNNFEIIKCASKELKLKQAVTDSAGAAHIYEYTFKH